MIRPGVTLGHWDDAERITVHGLAAIADPSVDDVRDVLTTFGIIPDGIDTVSVGELRAHGLIPKAGPAGEALRGTRAR